MIDCCESDSIIEMCANLDKSNTNSDLDAWYFVLFIPKNLFQLKPFSGYFYI